MDLQITSINEREKQGDQQAVLCDILQEFIHALSASDDTKVHVFQSLDEIMMLLLRVFGYGSSMARQKVMLSIRGLVYATGPEFGKFMPILDKYLGMGLQNVVGHICRAWDERILPFCDSIMSHLITDLSSGVIFSCFGDIGIAIGKHFEKYLPNVMPKSSLLLSKLFQNKSVRRETLPNSIFDAYSGILQGLKNSRQELLLPYAGHLLQVIKLVVREKTREECVSKAAVAAMGNLDHALGPNVKILFKEIATWTQRMINQGLIRKQENCR
ncbi:hypothetical protein MKX03_018018 [Papaver bracteatum]|nr:hypothetical protein MKX03_018018 [Papaver bracteatum]